MNALTRAIGWCFAAGLLLSAAAVNAQPSSELVMFERAGCPWCLRWSNEVEPIYPRTEFGKTMPLRKINLDRGTPADLVLESPVRFTPTFVIVRDGKEVGRITGYMNDAAFWGLLEKIAASADTR
jgi:thioredoxin-related protein